MGGAGGGGRDGGRAAGAEAGAGRRAGGESSWLRGGAVRGWGSLAAGQGRGETLGEEAARGPAGWSGEGDGAGVGEGLRSKSGLVGGARGGGALGRAGGGCQEEWGRRSQRV